MMGVPVRDVLAANLTAMQAPTGPHGIAPEEMQKILAAADQRAADAPSYCKGQRVAAPRPHLPDAL